MDAAEHDHFSVAAGGKPGEGEGVANVVGHVLDPRDLVVVGQDHGVAGFGQPAHLPGPFSEVAALVLGLAGDFFTLCDLYSE